MKCHNGLCGAATAAAQKKKINTYKSLAGLKSLLASLEEEFGRLTLYVTILACSIVYSYSKLLHTVVSHPGHSFVVCLTLYLVRNWVSLYVHPGLLMPSKRVPCPNTVV